MPDIDMVDSMRRFTINVKVKRGTELVWRIRIAKWLIVWAAWFLNCNIDVDGLDE